MCRCLGVCPRGSLAHAVLTGTQLPLWAHSMKTSLFKWSKDPLLASGYYEQAGAFSAGTVNAPWRRFSLTRQRTRRPRATALLFHASKNVDMRVQALLKAAACQKAVRRCFVALVLACIRRSAASACC